jgi:hypothetical protein
MLEAGYSDLSPRDDRNGHTVFVAGRPGIYTNGEHGVHRQRLYVWTQQGGFQEATSRFPKCVRQHLIHDLRKEMSLEDDPERRENFQKIIAELEDLIKQGICKVPLTRSSSCFLTIINPRITYCLRLLLLVPGLIE